MKATKITYSRLFSKGNFENGKIEIELQIEEGEKAIDVYNAAKKFVEDRVFIEQNPNTPSKKESALKVLENKEKHSYIQVMNAQAIVDLPDDDDDLPF